MLSMPMKWKTDDEIEFIKSLSPANKIKYAEAFCNRKNWGDIDPNRIRELLDRIQKKNEI